MIAPAIPTCSLLDATETLWCVRSLFYNDMGAEGTAALAKVLPETQIKDLKCAAAESVIAPAIPLLAF